MLLALKSIFEANLNSADTISYFFFDTALGNTDYDTDTSPEEDSTDGEVATDESQTDPNTDNSNTAASPWSAIVSALGLVGLTFAGRGNSREENPPAENQDTSGGTDQTVSENANETENNVEKDAKAALANHPEITFNPETGNYESNGQSYSTEELATLYQNDVQDGKYFQTADGVREGFHDGVINVVGTTRFQQVDYDGHDNKFEYGFGEDEQTTENVKCLRINGSEVTDGSIVKLGSDGKMQVVDIQDVKENSIIFVNGIKNNPVEALENISVIQNTVNQDVYLVYNLSEGFGKDSVNAIVGKLGVNTEPASQNILTELVKSGKVDTLIGHSEGSMISGNALIAAKEKDSESLEKVNWVTFGGIQGWNSIPGGLKSGTFYQNVGDAVPVLGVMGRQIKSLINGYEVVDTYQTGHSFTSSYGNSTNDYFNRKKP